MAVYQQSGIKTYDDIELQDFKWQIVDAGVRCFPSMQAWVEIEAWEIHKRHNRRFDIEMPTDLNDFDTVYARTLELTTFQGSTLIEE